MKPMRKGRGTWTEYFISFLAVLIIGSIAAYLYSREKGIPAGIAPAVLPAFLLELAFYMAPGFGAVRRSLGRLPGPVLALGLSVSAVVPYAVATLRLGSFRLTAFFALAGLAAVISFWYVALKPRLIVDLLFLAVTAAVFLSPLFRMFYPEPVRGLPLLILGRLAWIHVSITAVLLIRRIEAGFGFLPTPHEWRVGLALFACFLPVGFVLAYVLHFAHFRPLPLVWWKMPLIAAGTFAGILWVVALAEEFFFRGFLQQILTRSLRSGVAGLVIASALFGAAHLPFQHFPNWRFAIIGAVAGIFYGIGFMNTKSIRAPMVTHACVVTVWRLLFS